MHRDPHFPVHIHQKQDETYSFDGTKITYSELISKLRDKTCVRYTAVRDRRLTAQAIENLCAEIDVLRQTYKGA